MTRWCAGRRDRADESGTVAVVVAFFAVVMFGFAAIVVDLGQARTVRVQLQTTADAAALAATDAVYAGGTPVPDLPGAVAAAAAYAAKNAGVSAGEWASCTDPGRPVSYAVPAGSTPCISFSPTLTRPARVRVSLPVRSTTSYFSGALGLGTPRVGGTAEADVRISPPAPCALCVLRGGTHDLAQGDVEVYGGSISFNGNLGVGHNGILAANGSIFVEGTVSGFPSSAQPTPVIGQPRLEDPLVSYPLPTPPTYGGLATTVKTDPCSQGPGIYGTFTFPNGSTCTLSAGLYVVAGSSTTTTSTWTLQGNAGTRLVGNGVTLMFTCGTPGAPRTCNAGESGAGLDISGQGSATLSAPTSGILSGFTVVYDRNSVARFKVAGSASSTLLGTVYAPNATAVMNGNGCIDSYSVLFITGDLITNGTNSCLTMTYVPSGAAQLRPDRLHLTQ